MVHKHHQWLAEMSTAIARDYEDLQAKLSGNPSAIQESGHQAEAAWVALLQGWLPSTYEVATRKYLILEDSNGPEISNETDIVVFHPSYPPQLRSKPHVLVSGVVAAFSVKATLTRAGLEEAVKEAAVVKRGVISRAGTPQDDLMASPVYGLLAHSHSWKSPASEPNRNVTSALRDFDSQYAATPREGLDLVCVADLNFWSRATIAMSRHVADQLNQNLGDLSSGAYKESIQSGFMKRTTFDEGDRSADAMPPSSLFVGTLWNKLARFHSDLKPIADGLRVTGTSGSGSIDMRHWAFNEVFSSSTMQDMQRGRFAHDNWSWM